MTEFHLLKTRVSPSKLSAFLIRRCTRSQDFGHGAHQMLREIWPHDAPQPFRLREIPGAIEIWGYGSRDAPSMNELGTCTRNPELLDIFESPGAPWIGRPMPTISVGTRVGFELRAAAICRGDPEEAKAGGSKKKVERDALKVYRLRHDGEGSRDEAYRWWLSERLYGPAKIRAASLNSFYLRAFQHTTTWRRGAGKGRSRPASTFKVPDALMAGDLTVEDETSFANLLTHGVGRHKAFGFGMLLLTPPSCSRDV